MSKRLSWFLIAAVLLSGCAIGFFLYRGALPFSFERFGHSSSKQTFSSSDVSNDILPSAAIATSESGKKTFATSCKQNVTDSTKERKLIEKEMQELLSSLPELRRGRSENTTATVWNWWQTKTALQDEFLIKYPQMEEIILNEQIAIDSRALTVLESVDTDNINPVQRQEKYDKEDELASAYVQHIDNFLEIAANEQDIRSAQFAKVNLLEHYDVTKQPSSFQHAQAGKSFEGAYSSGLRDGKCLLRTAKFAAEKYAEGEEYSKAIAILEKAIADANSGRYEVRDLGGLNPLAQMASLSDMTSMISQYENEKQFVGENRETAEKYDQFMKDQIAEEKAFVEEYRKRIERGEVPATGLPENGEAFSEKSELIGETNSGSMSAAARTNTTSDGTDEKFDDSGTKEENERLLEEVNALGEPNDFLGE